MLSTIHSCMNVSKYLIETTQGNGDSVWLMVSEISIQNIGKCVYEQGSLHWFGTKWHGERKFELVD